MFLSTTGGSPNSRKHKVEISGKDLCPISNPPAKIQIFVLMPTNNDFAGVEFAFRAESILFEAKSGASK